MKQLSGGQAAVASLQTEKVEQVFGLIGSATMEMFDALYDATDINFIGVHDERTGEVGEAVQAALDCGRPAVIDIAIDPAALYSFRRDSFKHRGG
jgi:thiamine pyrophosphate-dependent acetolactate synthase large subunit-like protein